MASCGMKDQVQWLMPTPLVYLDGRVRPFRHLPDRDRKPEIEVFYATNRSGEEGRYGIRIADRMSYGTARMRIGEPADDWAALVKASTVDPRENPMPVDLLDHQEVARDGDPASTRMWLEQVDRSLKATMTRDIVLYVHGAKVGFHHSCAFAAELDHFAGRDFTSMAFDWPTHQNIISYIDRIDLAHARQSSSRLADLLEKLSSGTSVRRIHIVSWSAGARVLSRALAELGERGGGGSGEKLRLGTVVFAASDVPESDFLTRLPVMHSICERLIIYVSDADFALKWSSRLMGGGRRLGLEPEQLDETEIAMLQKMPRVELIDVSYGKAWRGFDITGHRYWFQHPWVNSDLVLALRTGAPANRRALKSGRFPGVHYFGPDYPSRIGGAARRLTAGSW